MCDDVPDVRLSPEKRRRAYVSPRDLSLHLATPLPAGAQSQKTAGSRATGPPGSVGALPLQRPPCAGCVPPQGTRRRFRRRRRSHVYGGDGWRPPFFVAGASRPGCHRRRGGGRARRISCAFVGGAISREACRPSGGPRAQRAGGEKIEYLVVGELLRLHGLAGWMGGRLSFLFGVRLACVRKKPLPKLSKSGRFSGITRLGSLVCRLHNLRWLLFSCLVVTDCCPSKEF